MQSREGFTPAEMKMMCLSAETLEGLRITGIHAKMHQSCK